MNWVITFLAGFLSGLFGAMGLGGGGVLLIYLTLFAGMEQLQAQGVNLLFFIPIGTVATIIYAIKKKIKWKTVLIFATLGIVGSGFGTYISKLLGGTLLSKLFGGALILTGVWQLFSRQKEKPVV